MKRTGRKLALLLALVCAIGAGATFSFLSFKTEGITNTFTSNRNVNIELKEPNWDDYQLGDKVEGTPGVAVKPGSEGNMDLGLNQAKNYLPGDVINKNPTIKNNSTYDKAYVAFKLVFTDYLGDSMTREQFAAAYGTLDISNTFKEIEVGDSVLYVYETALDVNTSVELFKKVTLNSNIALINGALPNFKIEATGYAVQGNIDFEVAKTELIALAK